MPSEHENPIVGIDFEKDTQTLTIAFSSGETLQYSNVTPEEAAALFQAQSFGDYIDAVLKDHPRQRID